MREEESGVALRIASTDDAVVSADFDRIEQVLGNLVDNAFRHTPAGGSIEAGVRGASPGFVEFYVSDSGTGISAAELPHVFDRFYRSSGEPSGTGTGLGLAISREIVRAHGGQIRAEASSAGGTTFVFTLPVAGGASPSPSAEPRERQSPRATPPAEVRRAGG